MINEEAQRIIDGYIVSANYTNEVYVDCVNVEALRVASVALEKQVPQKPVELCNRSFVCSRCKQKVIRHQSFCDICGQFLDWKEVGE